MENRIILDDTYFITTDTYNYILNQKCMIFDKKEKINKPGEKVVGYYSKIEDVLKGYIRCIEKDVADNLTGTIVLYVEQIKEQTEKLYNQLQKTHHENLASLKQ